jgi:5'-methylthioadenosine phosphorylase
MIGIIGGTGLYQLESLHDVEQHEVETPFGTPSAPITTGRVHSTRVAFLPRHGLNHEHLPSEINYRANIWGLKSLGVRQIVSVSATGSLQEEIRPGDLALPNQYLDWTKGKRDATFFGDGLSAHISTAEPVCSSLCQFLLDTAASIDISLHRHATYACVEGPRLGTRAESHLLRQMGAHLVGMTNVPEVFLAREAGLCYATIAVATDYDCWMENPDQHATVAKVIALYKENLGRVERIIAQILEAGMGASDCHCKESLAGAVMTPENRLSERRREILDFLRK